MEATGYRRTPERSKFRRPRRASETSHPWPKGITHPFRIQQLSLRSPSTATMIGQAKTGTGKTLAAASRCSERLGTSRRRW